MRRNIDNARSDLPDEPAARFIAQPRPSPRDLGAVAVALAYRWADWVDRRDLLIEFVEDTTIRRTTRISFTLPDPDKLAAPIEPGALIYVPLQILAKQTLMNSVITDETGARLSPLNTQRNGHVAGDGLVVMMTTELAKQGLTLTAATERELRTLASSPSIASDLTRVFGPPQDASRLAMALNVGKTSESPQAQIIRDLAEGFLQLVQLPYEPGRQREIAVAYDARQEWDHESAVTPTRARATRALTALGGLPRIVEFSDIAIGRSQSTHVEIVAPDEMQLLIGTLEGSQYDTGDLAARERARRTFLRKRRWYDAADDDERAAALRAPISADQLDLDNGLTPIAVTTRSTDRSRSRVHLHARLLAGSEFPLDDPKDNQRGEAQVLGRNDLATVRVAILPRRNGPIPATTAMAVLTAVTLWVFAARLGELDGQTSAAVLLLAPVVVGAYVSRPGEHSYTTRALAWIRRAAVAIGLLALVLSGMIAAKGLTTTNAPTNTVLRTLATDQDCVATVQAHVRQHRSVVVPLKVACPSAKTKAVRVTGPPESHVRPGATVTALILAAVSTTVALLLITSFLIGRAFDQFEVDQVDEPEDAAFESAGSLPTSATTTVST